jgi:hypothetical protein
MYKPPDKFALMAPNVPQLSGPGDSKDSEVEGPPKSPRTKRAAAERSQEQVTRLALEERRDKKRRGN